MHIMKKKQPTYLLAQTSCCSGYNSYSEVNSVSTRTGDGVQTKNRETFSPQSISIDMKLLRCAIFFGQKGFDRYYVHEIYSKQRHYVNRCKRNRESGRGTDANPLFLTFPPKPNHAIDWLLTLSIEELFVLRQHILSFLTLAFSVPTAYFSTCIFCIFCDIYLSKNLGIHGSNVAPMMRLMPHTMIFSRSLKR